MKKTKIIIPLALSLILAGCTVGGGNAASSADSASSSPSSAIESSSSSDGKDSGGIYSSDVTPDEDVSSEKKDEKKDLTIDDIANYAVAFFKQKGTVSEGTLTKTDEDAYSSSSVTTNYYFGSDANGDTMEVTSEEKTVYVMKDASGEIVSVTKNDYGDYVKGDEYLSIAPHFEDYIDGHSSYGAEGFLGDMAKAAKESLDQDFEAYEKDGKAYFSFGFLNSVLEDDLPTYWAISGNFGVDDPSLKQLTVTFDQYNYGDYDYSADDKKVVLKADVSASRTTTYGFTQTIGEKTHAIDISLADFEYTTFALKDQDGNVLGADHDLTIKEGDYAELTIDGGPSTANLHFDAPKLTVKSVGDATSITGEGTRNDEGTSETFAVYATDAVAGDYEVEVATKNCKVSFTIHVTEIKPEKIAIRHYTKSPSGGYRTSPLSDGDTIQTYMDVVNYFTVSISPNDANRAFSYKVTYPDGSEMVNSEAITVNLEDCIYPGDEDYERTAVSFACSEAGEYNFTLYSVADESIKETFTISVSNSDFASMLDDKTFGVREKTLGGVAYTFLFDVGVAAGDVVDASRGTVSINREEAISYAMNQVDGEDYYEFIFAEGAVDFSSLILGADGNLYIDFDGNEYYSVYDADDPYYRMPRSWSYEHGEDDYYSVDNLYFYDDGTVSGTISEEDGDDDYYLNCEYSIAKKADGDYTITFFDDGYVDESSNDWFDSLPATATLNSDFTQIELDACGMDDPVVLLEAPILYN